MNRATQPFKYQFRWHSTSFEQASPTAEHLLKDMAEVASRATQHSFPFTPDQTIMNEYVWVQGIDPYVDLEDQFENVVCDTSLNDQV